MKTDTLRYSSKCYQSMLKFSGQMLQARREWKAIFDMKLKKKISSKNDLMQQIILQIWGKNKYSGLRFQGKKTVKLSSRTTILWINNIFNNNYIQQIMWQDHTITLVLLIILKVNSLIYSLPITIISSIPIIHIKTLLLVYQ